MRHWGSHRPASALAAGVVALACMQAWSDEANAADAGTAPPDWFLFGVIVLVIFAVIVALFLIRAAVAKTKWSLSDALSEDVGLTAMDSDGKPLMDDSKKPIMVTEMRASTSRLIALMGMMMILLMFIGFGSFAMYRFATTGDMPASLDGVIKFLLSGLTLFAPYLVNKFASVFESLKPKP